MSRNYNLLRHNCNICISYIRLSPKHDLRNWKITLSHNHGVCISWLQLTYIISSVITFWCWFCKIVRWGQAIWKCYTDQAVTCTSLVKNKVVIVQHLSTKLLFIKGMVMLCFPQFASIDNKAVWVQVMTWSSTGDKLLSESMVGSQIFIL